MSGPRGTEPDRRDRPYGDRMQSGGRGPGGMALLPGAARVRTPFGELFVCLPPTRSARRFGPSSGPHQAPRVDLLLRGCLGILRTSSRRPSAPAMESARARRLRSPSQPEEASLSSPPRWFLFYFVLRARVSPSHALCSPPLVPASARRHSLLNHKTHTHTHNTSRSQRA